MKKAFDQNVSRSRPRVRLGSMLGEGAGAETPLPVEAIAQAIAAEPAPVIPDLAHQVRARAEAAKEPRPTAVQQLRSALTESHAAEAKLAQAPPEVEALRPEPEAKVAQPLATPAFEAREREPRAAAPAYEPVALAASFEPVVEERFEPVMPVRPAPLARAAPTEAPKARVRASAEAPAQVVEVQAPRPPQAPDAQEPDGRRERLKERLKAVRENPRPEPLPETVAEAGVLAVERISALQTEVVKVRSVNLALSQDLEATRRQAERATEEARLRMDEARRLSGEMDTRAKLLADLERELGALEGERNESLLALQEARTAIEAGERDKDALRTEVAKRDQALADSLSEEERLASELEQAHEASGLLRRSVDTLRQERDTLARQVSDLTRERAELLEARKALEAVHRALSKAATR